MTIEQETKQSPDSRKRGMGSYCVSLVIFLAIIQAAVAGGTVRMKSDLLCSQCKKCDTDKCPPSAAYPHMTAFDNSLIAGALQSDYVKSDDKGVYSVPNIIGGVSTNNNSYFGWESTSGSASGYHRKAHKRYAYTQNGITYINYAAISSYKIHLWTTRFRNYMVKCSDESYLSVDKHGTVKLQALKKLSNLSDADWKSVNPPKKLNHREFRFWVSHSTGKCLTVFEGKKEKRTLGVADCEFDGANPFQLFAFRFHYHKAFCCCGKYNE